MILYDPRCPGAHAYLALAEELMAAGAHVVRLARSLADAEAERRTDIRCDLSEPEQVAAAAARVAAAVGVPDVLVHNAGAFLLRTLVETTPEEFAAAMDWALSLDGPSVVEAFVDADAYDKTVFD